MYQVATGILPEGLIAPALRLVVHKQKNTKVVLGGVVDLDLEARTVWALAPDGARVTLPYDTLVVAAGATHAYFGHDDWAEFAPGMKTLEDARQLRNHILGAFEMAELATDGAERKACLSFVVVGAGPTGVEVVGQIAELARVRAMRRSTRLRGRSHRKSIGTVVRRNRSRWSAGQRSRWMERAPFALATRPCGCLTRGSAGGAPPGRGTERRINQ